MIRHYIQQMFFFPGLYENEYQMRNKRPSGPQTDYKDCLLALADIIIGYKYAEYHMSTLQKGIVGDFLMILLVVGQLTVLKRDYTLRMYFVGGVVSGSKLTLGDLNRIALTQ